MRFEGTSCSFCNLLAVSTPAAGTRYSNWCPGDGTDPSGSAYGKGRYSGNRPSWTSTVAWSHAICSWNKRSPRMLTTEVNGTRRYLPVGGIPGILSDYQVCPRRKNGGDSHPVHLLQVGEDENELIDDSIRSYRSADQFQGRIVGVVENEVIEVKVTQSRSPNTTSQLFIVSVFTVYIVARLNFGARTVGTWLTYGS